MLRPPDKDHSSAATGLQRFWLEETKWLGLADSYAQVERVTTYLESVNGAATRAMGERVQAKALRALPRRSDSERQTIEAHLDQAEEAVCTGARHIERQNEIIIELEQKGQDAATAKGLLETFLALQNEHVSHRDRLRKELGLDPDAAQ